MAILSCANHELLWRPFTLGELYGVIGERSTIDWGAEKAEREAKKARRAKRREARQQRRIEGKMQERKANRQEQTKKGETSMMMKLRRSVSDSVSGLLFAGLTVIAPSAYGQPVPEVVDWINLATVESGVHEVSYAELVASGADLAGLSAEEISIVNQGNSIPVKVLGGDTFGPCLLYTSPSPRDLSTSRMPSSA